MCGSVKNRNRRPRFTGNPSKRSEVPAIRRASSAPVRVPRNVKAADESHSIVERQDEKKLTSHGGFEGIADKKLPTSAERQSHGFWSFDSEALQGLTYLVLWSRYAVCAFVSLIGGIMIERWSKCALDGIAIVASILLVVFVSAKSDYKQFLQSKDSHAQQEKIAVPVTRNGVGQELPTRDLRPGEIVHLGDQVPADGHFITGDSLLENESSLAGDGKPINASGVGIPFLLPGTEVQYRIAQDACDPSSNDRACATDESIRQLVHDLKSGSLDKGKQAASKIRLLTKNKSENCIRIAQADTIKPLIALILSPDSQAQQYGVTAILNLSLCDENKELIAMSGSIKPLVEALRTGTPTAKENAACALLHLSKTKEKKKAIGQLGAIPPLVSLLKSKRLQGKKDALTALYSLCSEQENRLSAVRAGAMRLLVELMKDLKSSLVDKAASVVMRLIGAAEAKAILVAQEGMPVLVNIVGDGTQKQKEIAVKVLLWLCKDSVAYQTMVVQAGVKRLRVGLTSDVGSSMVDEVARMVSMLMEAMGPAEARAAVKGEIPMLVEMVEKGTQRQKEIAMEVLEKANALSKSGTNA